jgi:hypothetical protein
MPHCFVSVNNPQLQIFQRRTPAQTLNRRRKTSAARESDKIRRGRIEKAGIGRIRKKEAIRRIGYSLAAIGHS